MARHRLAGVLAVLALVAASWSPRLVRAEPASMQPAQPTQPTPARPTHSTQPTQAPAPEYTFDVRAHFFQHATGGFKVEEATTAGGFNTFIYTDTLFVFVDISGPRFPIGKNASLSLLARGAGKVLERKWLSLHEPYFSESGHITVPFVIHGAGLCSSIELTVVLQVRGKRQTIRRSVPLACGE